MAHHCFQCGEILIEQAEEGKLREVCPRCGWTYYPQLRVGAGVLVEQDGRALLVQRTGEPWKGAWCFPAGFIEPGEPPEQAAAREIREETGLQVEITGLVDIYFYDDDPRGNGLLLLYRGRRVGGEQQPTSETAQVQYFRPEEIPGDLAGGGNDRAVRAWQRQPQS
jgi:8-oxo-dGTP diphosphatase